MKGFLTFTLAAGVAIATTSIAQAASVGRVAMNAERTATTQRQAPMSIGAMSKLTLDRPALNRELSRLSALLEPVNEEQEVGTADDEGQKQVGVWTF